MIANVVGTNLFALAFESEGVKSMIIGITGNSGSGKTEVSKFLKNKLKADVINADIIVKSISVPGTKYFNEIVKIFGTGILLENGYLNKTKISKIIFSDNNEREKLNTLTFKYVVEEIKRKVNSCNSDIIIIDAPLLIESKLNEICNIVICVIADKNIKLKRIMSRDNIDEETARMRLNSQPDDNFYKLNSNIVIVNNNNNLEKNLTNLKELIQSKIIKNNGKKG